jgi:hypothetical protein
MFTRLFNTIRDTIARGPNRTVNNNNKQLEHSSSEYSDINSRRPSVTEELQNNDTHSMFSTSQSLPVNRIGRNSSVSTNAEPISINDSTFDGKRRRSSTLFGISNVTADDYVQKDLISSSWS